MSGCSRVPKFHLLPFVQPSHSDVSYTTFFLAAPDSVQQRKRSMTNLLWFQMFTSNTVNPIRLLDQCNGWNGLNGWNLHPLTLNC